MRVKNRVTSERPWHCLHETEPDSSGSLKRVNTIFLTNSECPFKCIMCDLWKNTLDEPAPPGTIPSQIEWALDRLPDAPIVKLYNSGNFFDRRAIPPSDYRAIADLLTGYDRVIIENHPSLCNDSVLEFRDMLRGRLEIAMGLETIHPVALPAINKQMTVDQFADAARFLTENEIGIRAFVLLNPPFIPDPEENIEWALRSIRFAFEHGAGCCSVIPVRADTTPMQKLLATGAHVPPTLGALETVMERALEMTAPEMKGRRVFADLWDLERFSDCDDCFEIRKERLSRMNLTQQVPSRIDCVCGLLNG